MDIMENSNTTLVSINLKTLRVKITDIYVFKYNSCFY